MFDVIMALNEEACEGQDVNVLRAVAFNMAMAVYNCMVEAMRYPDPRALEILTEAIRQNVDSYFEGDHPVH